MRHSQKWLLARVAGKDSRQSLKGVKKMGSGKLRRVTPLFCLMILCSIQGFAGEKEGGQNPVNSGTIEIECNISHLDLYLCSGEKYQEKEARVFFGLIKSKKFVCSDGGVPLGKTPVKPVYVPPGKYVLLIPEGYRWEHDGPIEIDVESGKRNYFLLKLFSSRADGSGDDHGAGGGGGSAGGGRP